VIDLFPSLYGTLKASTYFSTTLSGFEDGSGRFKVFKRNESPDGATPFVMVEIEPGGQHRLSEWASPFVTFTVYGADTQWPLLYEIAENIRDVFKNLSAFAAVGEDDPIQYELIGNALFGEGENPVTEQVTVSVALRFGIVE
jgi:hypothetical protein